MIKKRLEFSRIAAIVVIVAMSGSGVKALVSSFANPVNTGSISIQSKHVVGELKDAQAIGNVNVGVLPVSSTAGCDSNIGTTNADKNSGTYGGVTLTNCRVASGEENNSAKKYELNIAGIKRDGYEYAAAIQGYRGQIKELEAGKYFYVDKNQTTTIVVFMRQLPESAAPSGQQTNAPRPEDKNGALEVTTYNYFTGGKLARQGGVRLKLESVNQDNNNPAVRCNEVEKTTDQAGGSEQANANYAQANWTGCWTSRDGSKGYRFVEIGEPSGHKFRSIRVTNGKFANNTESSVNLNEPFTINKNAKTSIAIWMDPPPGEAVPAPAQPTGTADNRYKNGTIAVETYVFESKESQIPIGNVEVTINSVGTDNTNINETCDETTNKTDSNDGSRQANANYGKAKFANCFTGTKGEKQYDIQRLSVPAGYAFRSIRIGNGEFVSGATETQNLSERFLVKKDVTTRVVIWLTKVAISVPQQPGSGSTAQPGAPAQTVTSQPVAGGSVRQVVTQAGGISYQAANNKPTSQQLAATLNTAISAGQINPAYILQQARAQAGSGEDEDEDDNNDEDSDDPEDNEGEPTPPQAPANLSAKQNESGSIELTWSPAKGDPESEKVTYFVARKTVSTGETEEIFTDSPNYTDTGDEEELGHLKYPNSYEYIIRAEDENEDASATKSILVTTVALPPNVTAAIAAAQAADTTDDNDVEEESPENGAQTVEIEDDSVDLEVDVPLNAHESPMACDVSNANSSDDDLLAARGESIRQPAEITCREEDGDTVDEFDNPVTMELEIDPDEDTDDSDLYAFDGTDWEEIELDGSEEDSENGVVIKYASAKRIKSNKVKGKSVIRVKTKQPLRLALIKKTDDVQVNPIVALPAFILLAGAVLYVLHRRGFDPVTALSPQAVKNSLAPRKSDPTLDYVQPVNQVQTPSQNYTGYKPEQVIRPEGWSRREDDNEQK